MLPSRKGWVLGLVLAAGCGGSAPPARPVETVRAYRLAVERRDPVALHALLSAETRAEVSVEALARALEASGPELVREASRMETAAALGFDERAELPLREGPPVELVREPSPPPAPLPPSPGAAPLASSPFVIDGGAFEIVALATPEQAVRALREALIRGDLALFLAVLAAETRVALETERDRLLEETADPADLEVEIDEDRATVRLTGGRVLPLVREGGTWRVMDLP